MLCCFKVIELLKAGTSTVLRHPTVAQCLLSSQVCHAVVQESPSRFSRMSRSRPAERAAAAKTTALESQLEFYKSALGDQIARVHVPFCQALCQASQHRPVISLSSVFSRSAFVVLYTWVVFSARETLLTHYYYNYHHIGESVTYIRVIITYNVELSLPTHPKTPLHQSLRAQQHAQTDSRAPQPHRIGT